MYRFDWIERLKLGSGPPAAGGQVSAVHPVIVALGLTSFLTDIASEMVSSLLPVYLFLHLRLSPFEYGAIDGILNGLSIALVGLGAGLLADHSRRQKWIAAAGYGLSALAKLLLAMVGGAWAAIGAVLALDRLGKGIRTAPRDALISLYAPAASFGTAFGLHRAMDAAGALLGPILAFALLWQIGDDFTAIWLVSFVIACLGLAALWLFVPSRTAALEQTPTAATVTPPPWRTAFAEPRFVALAVCGALLASTTISDAFVYLMLQEKGSLGGQMLPLFFVATAAAYMLFSIPVGRAADRFGRRRVLLTGYATLVVLYAIVAASTHIAWPLQVLCLALLGLYYAATEGVLMALVSALVPAPLRTTGLALLLTGIGLGKLVSSVLFGWSWQTLGLETTVMLFMASLSLILLGTAVWLGAWRR